MFNRKLVLTTSTLLLALGVSACSIQNHKHASHTEHSSLQVKHSSHSTSSKKATSKTNASQSLVAKKSSNNRYASQINNDEWYILAYLDKWGYNDLQDNPVLRLYDGKEITMGTTDSTAETRSISDTSVVIAASSGDGAFSTFDDVTFSKSELINKFIHSDADLSKLADITNTAISQAKADMASIDERDNADANDTVDDEDEDY